MNEPKYSQSEKYDPTTRGLPKDIAEAIKEARRTVDLYQYPDEEKYLGVSLECYQEDQLKRIAASLIRELKECCKTDHTTEEPQKKPPGRPALRR